MRRFERASYFVHPEMSEIPPRHYPLFAVLCLGVGLFLLYLGAMNPPELKSPPWVIYAFSLVWFATSARLIEMSQGRPGRGDWYAFIFCVGFGAGSASIPWSGHPEACHSGGFSFGMVGSNSMGGINLCQRVFGAVGFLMLFLALVIAWRWIASHFGKKPSYY